MQRRDFLKSTATVVGTVSWATVDAISAKGAEDKIADPEKLIARVKHAMLTMQRASWEQGVAAQAY